MSNLRSTPLKSSTSTATGGGCATLIGAVLVLLSAGPLCFFLNGGYSIQGMAWLGEHTGEYGRLFWAVATAWTVEAPIAARAGLPIEQPVLPWLLVIGISFLEVGLFFHRLRGGRAEWWVDGGGYTASAFDYTTTAIGLMFAPFVADASALARFAWAALALALAVPLTFGFEGILARVLRGR